MTFRYVFRIPPVLSDEERAEDLRAWRELGEKRKMLGKG